MAVYHGDIETDTGFDPEVLSAAFGRVEFKSKADTTAEQIKRPIGLLVPRDLARPLLYLALLLELGNESTTHLKIKVMISKPAAKGEFQKLTDN
jgi:hypothetical protein